MMKISFSFPKLESGLLPEGGTELILSAEMNKKVFQAIYVIPTRDAEYFKPEDWLNIFERMVAQLDQRIDTE